MAKSLGLAFKPFKDFAGREFGDQRRELFGETRTMTQRWRDTGEMVGHTQFFSGRMQVTWRQLGCCGWARGRS